MAFTIAQHKDISGFNALFGGYPVVECLLGTTVRRAVNECVGFAANGNLQDHEKGLFVSLVLSTELCRAAIPMPTWLRWRGLMNKCKLAPGLTTKK